MEYRMFEFMRYTLLVFVGLASMLAMFASLALTGSIVAETGGFDQSEQSAVTFWILGLSAIIICASLSKSFVRRIPRAIFQWLRVNRDSLAVYCVVTAIFFVFVAS